MIFIGNLEYSDRSAYVIGFDIVDPGLKAQVQQTGIEFFIGGKINLDDPRIKVRYHGPNFMKAVA